ncbi:hypothetical protein DY000_02027893 [Brassica cretica]|uniref:Hexosyltransferase n=1 Tax=Brassica cretica TaxID=69181 RepID=A0ABQ7EH95_BRACR|nr:hypothetical protein DY000_02027893 [Brassica cretica]
MTTTIAMVMKANTKIPMISKRSLFSGACVRNWRDRGHSRWDLRNIMNVDMLGICVYVKGV